MVIFAIQRWRETYQAREKVMTLRPTCFFMLAALATSMTFTETAFSRVLEPGQSIGIGEKLSSEDNRYYATLQPDGNFVVYQDYGSHRAVWATRTVGKGAVRAALQGNGDFVLLNAANVSIWHANSQGPHRKLAITEHGQAMVLGITDWWVSNTGDQRYKQKDALIFPYGFSLEPGKTYAQGMYSFSFQTDGNVVLRRNGAPLWATYTYGATHAQVGHGLIVTDASGERFRMKGRRWSEPDPGTSLYITLGSVAVFPDGNLVAYRATRVWSSPKDWYETR